MAGGLTSSGSRLRAYAAGSIVIVSLMLIATSAGQAQVASLESPGPEAGGTADPEAAPLEGQDALLAYAGCLRDNGIEVDDPRFDASGAFIGGLGKDAATIDFKGDAYQTAAEACMPLLSAVKPTLDAEQQAESLERKLAYAACMRDEGIDMPDPGVSGAVDGPSKKLDTSSGGYQRAQAACASGPGAAPDK